MVDYSRLRDKCCYCFRTPSSGLSVCGCLLSFCDDHLPLHKNKSSCEVLFYVEGKGTLTVTGENLTEDEKVKICKRIEIILKCKNYEEKVVLKEGEVECPHLQEEYKDKIRLGKDTTCGECPISKNLYVCLSCGFVGCGRLQYGVEGNGHALNHYKVTGHEVAVLVQSITPEYACDTFCYKCNDFIVNPFCDNRLVCESFSEPGASLFDIPCEGEPVSDPSPFLGLKNAGNTCYISSVLQLYGFVVSKKDISLDTHFSFCEYQNPLHCFYCQTVRILNEMKKKYVSHSNVHSDDIIHYVSINDFLRLLWLEIPMFTKNTQHDANEFFMIFTQKIKEAEMLGLFPPVTSFFSFEIENSKRCGNCRKNVLSMESHNMVYTPFSIDVQASLDLYFKDSPAPCDCGGEMWISNRIVTLPPFFIITLGRIIYKEEGYYKDTDSVGVDHVDLTNYLRKAKLPNYFLKELSSKGFSQADVDLAISGTNNFSELEARIEEYRRTHKTNPIYNIGGSIVHAGNSMDSGHYMWWVRALNSCFLVNDRSVTEDTVDHLENSYIMIFE